MPNETSLEQQRQRVRQWMHAGRELELQKQTDLRNLSESDSVRDADMLLDLALQSYRDPARQTYSGLVEQQRLFQKLRPS